ncbi:MAG: EF-hand domain-containing protein [Lysobacteraceae bacterium]
MTTPRATIPLLVALLALAGGTAFAQADGPRAGRGGGGERWAQLDRNNDGTIDRSEAEAHPKLLEHFERIDRDGDGRLSRQEVREARQLAQSRREARQSQSRAMQARFRWLDVDSDGTLTLAEIGEAAPKLSERFGAIDGNRDGRIGREEIRGYIKAQRDARRAAQA